VQCVQAVAAVLIACRGTPEVYATLEPICMPAMEALSTPDAVESLAELARMVNAFVLFSPVISADIWGMLPRLHYAHFNIAADQLEELYPVFDSYLSRGGDVIVASQNSEHNYLDMMLEICFEVLNQERAELDAQYAVKIIQVIAVYIGNKIPETLPALIVRIAQKITTSDYPPLVMFCGDALSVMCMVDAPFFFQTLLGEGDDFMKLVLNHWLTTLQDMQGKAEHLKKISLALSHVMRMDVSQLPEGVARGFANFLNTNLQALTWSVTAEADAKAHDLELYGDDAVDQEMLEQWGDMHDGDFEEEFEDWGDDADVDPDGEGGFMMGMMGGAFQRQFDNDVNNISEFKSPLDDYDEVIFFAESLEACRATNGEFVAQWQQSMPAELGELLEAMLHEAQTRRQEEQKVAQQ
jgi:hypothetical protein